MACAPLPRRLRAYPGHAGSRCPAGLGFADRYQRRVRAASDPHQGQPRVDALLLSARIASPGSHATGPRPLPNQGLPAARADPQDSLCQGASGSARSLGPSLLRRTSPAPPPASAWLAPGSLGLGGLAALGSIKHDVCLRVNTMFKQICNFARPGAARAQKKPPGCFYTRRLVAVDNDSTWCLKWLHHAYRLQFDR